MARTRFALVALSSCLLFAASADAQVQRSALHDFQLVPVVEGLVTPWSMAWLPNGDMLVTERPGRLRIVRDGELLPDAVPGIPEVHARGQGGLLDVQPHPDFANNHWLYITFSKPQADDQSTTTLIRGKFENDALTNVEELFEAVARGRNGHYGSRIAFAGGYVFISAGDRQAPSRGDLEAHPAQDRSNHHGVIIRLHDDGRVPADNPFIGEDDVRPETWSYGHRNPQGLAISSALLADFNYALMSAQSLAEVVSSVIAGAELLKQAEANPARFDLAASWINRRMVDLEVRCQRIKEGSAERLDRCDKIIALVK